MIHITNTQRKYNINISLVMTITQAMLDELGYSTFDVSILICGPGLMKQYNADFRHQNKPTDVLSFPFYPQLSPGEQIIADTPEDANLGDILLCPAVIDKKRHLWEREFDEQLIVLIAHALTHLLGYDHETDAEHEQMQAVEDRLLAAAYKSKE